MIKILLIHAEWDEEAEVWVATSDDVPGLATEADTLEQLSSKLESMIPELLDANGYPEDSDTPGQSRYHAGCSHSSNFSKYPLSHPARFRFARMPHLRVLSCFNTFNAI